MTHENAKPKPGEVWETRNPEEYYRRVEILRVEGQNVVIQNKVPGIHHGPEDKMGFDSLVRRVSPAPASPPEQAADRLFEGKDVCCLCGKESTHRREDGAEYCSACIRSCGGHRECMAEITRRRSLRSAEPAGFKPGDWVEFSVVGEGRVVAEYLERVDDSNHKVRELRCVPVTQLRDTPLAPWTPRPNERVQVREGADTPYDGQCGTVKDHGRWDVLLDGSEIPKWFATNELRPSAPPAPAQGGEEKAPTPHPVAEPPNRVAPSGGDSGQYTDPRTGETYGLAAWGITRPVEVEKRRGPDPYEHHRDTLHSRCLDEKAIGRITAAAYDARISAAQSTRNRDGGQRKHPAMWPEQFSGASWEDG